MCPGKLVIPRVDQQGICDSVVPPPRLIEIMGLARGLEHGGRDCRVFLPGSLC